MIPERLSTGVQGLDEILQGGVLANGTYLIRGGPGSGKTTLGWHFLTTDLTSESGRLFITLGESEAQLRRNGAQLGFDVSAIDILDLSPDSQIFSQDQTYDIFSPADIERQPLIQRIVTTIEHLKPERIFVDSMTQFRYLTVDTYQFRKQVVAFLRLMSSHGATVFFTSEASLDAPDEDLQFISDGIITLYLSEQDRTISVTKLRGANFRSGQHAFRLTDQGMQVFPRLLPDTGDMTTITPGIMSSGVPEIDELLAGGLEHGTVTIVTGPSGVGKSTLGMQFVKEAAGRGVRSVVYVFEEAVETLLNRCENINIPARAMVERGTLSVIKIEPLTHSPDEFANRVRQEVEQAGSRIVMLDSIAGYRLSFSDQEMVRHTHSLCQYLRSQGVTMIITNEVEMITGNFRATEAGISYLADNIVFLRYLELSGELRRAIGVLKKRLSAFERTLREFQITRYGIKVGEPFTQLRGILSGSPELVSSSPDDRKRPL